jgi:transposase, IS5 family
MARLLEQGCGLAGRAAICWRDHRRLAKKRAHAIQHSRGKERKAKLYRELIAVTRATKPALDRALAVLAACAGSAVADWCREVSHYLPLIERVMTQTRRRVFDGEAVPASEKVVSLFEPHADIIVKGGRAVQYGHKINLATGRSGLILDVVVETGNLADAERFLPMLERHIASHGQPPRQIAGDGGYASAANVTQAKALGVSDVAFHKKRHLGIESHGQKPLGVSQAAQFPRRHRGQHFLFEAGVWPGTLHLARAGALHLIRLVLGCRLQPGSLCATSRGHHLTAARIGHAEYRCPHVPSGTRKGCNCNYPVTKAGNCSHWNRSGQSDGAYRRMSSTKNPRLWTRTS